MCEKQDTEKEKKGMNLFQNPWFWVSMVVFGVVWAAAVLSASRRNGVWFLLLAVVVTAAVMWIWVPQALNFRDQHVLASVPTPAPVVVERVVEKPVTVTVRVPYTVTVEVPAATSAQPVVKLSAASLGVLVEVDQSTKVEQKGPGYRDVKFATDPGQIASAAIVFGAAGDLVDVRVVCDDTCTKIYLLKADGKVVELKPKVYGPKFDYAKLSVDREAAHRLGVNVKDSEILAQNFLLGPYQIAVGDQLVVYGADDPKLGVNRGIFASWNLK
ncbi:MAG: hypothetical protein ABIG91_01130 [Patescibacteria group bacterium]